MQAVIASYNFLGQLRDNSKELTFRVVIMDEAHYIKNKKVGTCLAVQSHPTLQMFARAFTQSWSDSLWWLALFMRKQRWVWHSQRS